MISQAALFLCVLGLSSACFDRMVYFSLCAADCPTKRRAQDMGVGCNVREADEFPGKEREIFVVQNEKGVKHSA